MNKEGFHIGWAIAVFILLFTLVVIGTIWFGEAL